MPALETSAGIRLLALRALALGLCVAGLVGVVALLTGDFSSNDARVVGTSFAFGLFSLTASAGVALRLRPERWASILGGAAIASSAAAFLLLVVVLWGYTGTADPPDGLVRLFVLALIAALWSAHACIVLGSRREDDAPAVRGATGVALVALGLDASAAALATAELVGHELIDDGARLFAAVLIVALVATMLIPLLRRMGPVGDARARDGAAPEATAAAAPWAAPARSGAPMLIAVAAAIGGLFAGLAIRGSERETRIVTVTIRDLAPAPPTQQASVPAHALRVAEDRLVQAVVRRHPRGSAAAECSSDAPPAVVCQVSLEGVGSTSRTLETRAVYSPDGEAVVGLDTSRP